MKCKRNYADGCPSHLKDATVSTQHHKEMCLLIADLSLWLNR